jgi:hypothetical protein
MDDMVRVPGTPTTGYKFSCAGVEDEGDDAHGAENLKIVLAVSTSLRLSRACLAKSFQHLNSMPTQNEAGG